jgi:2'-5' RNA ligase
MKENEVRLFTGFPIEVTESLAHAIKRSRINADQKDMELNWIPEANYHVTLNFIGATENSKINEIIQAIQAVTTNVAPLTTSLRGMGGFPDERHTRTLWIGVRKSRALRHLQDQLRESLSNAKFPQEDREYTPHLTVAKTRKSRSITDLISPHVRTQFGEVEVKSVLLYQSLFHGAQPVYKILNTFPLTGLTLNDGDTF